MRVYNTGATTATPLPYNTGATTATPLPRVYNTGAPRVQCMFIIQVQQRLRLFPPAAARVRAETAEAWHRPWNALRRRRAYKQINK